MRCGHRVSGLYLQTLSCKRTIWEESVMRKFLSVRILFLAALAFLAPAASRAQVSLGVSIRVAPPALPVYEQPPCPEEGYTWTPRILSLWRQWILLGARSVGRSATRWGSLDARLLGLA